MSVDPDQEPQRYTGHLIRRAQQAHVAAWSRLVSTETTSVQYTILVTLARLGEASQRRLCDEVDLDRSTIADLVARMQRRGLVQRHRDPTDARRNTVSLTEAGAAEHARLRPHVEEVDHELTGSLSGSDREQLRALLRRVLEDTSR